jgi:hypothetical protein
MQIPILGCADVLVKWGIIPLAFGWAQIPIRIKTKEEEIGQIKKIK